MRMALFRVRGTVRPVVSPSAFFAGLARAGIDPAEAAPLLPMVPLAVAEWAMAALAEGRAETAEAALREADRRFDVGWSAWPEASPSRPARAPAAPPDANEAAGPPFAGGPTGASAVGDPTGGSASGDASFPPAAGDRAGAPALEALPDGPAFAAARSCLLEAVAGRVLTFEQLVRRLKRTECSDLASREEALLFLVQALLDEGALRLAAGMGLEVRDGAPVFVCRRCGTASRTVETHLCADCGTEDVFCPACAALGPVRGCTAVFRAAEASGASGTVAPAVRSGRAPDGRPAERPEKEAAKAPEAGEAGAAGDRERDAARFGEKARPPAVAGAAGTGGESRRARLTPAQRQAAEAVRAFVAGAFTEERDRPGGALAESAPMVASENAPCRGTAEEAPPPALLLWAVTGAGKTEMLFPAVEALLSAGRRVLWATPRRDVVLELWPRLRAAFPGAVVALYGGAEAFAEASALTLSTTHQALLFERFFDVVIVDEADAFPYTAEPFLPRAVRRALRPGGRIVIVTATPSAEDLADVQASGGAVVIVPLRHHGRPLPEPEVIRLKRPIFRGEGGRSAVRMPAAALDFIGERLRRGRRVFAFVPRVADVPEAVAALASALNAAGRADADAGRAAAGSDPSGAAEAAPDGARADGVRIAGTHAGDDGRDAKVRAFREGALDVLVTTTILERGVTVAGSDVVVLDADARVFDAPTLIQIAGRAGRMAEDDTGAVAFFAAEETEGIRRAAGHIAAMNRLAETAPAAQQLVADDPRLAALLPAGEKRGRTLLGSIVRGMRPPEALARVRSLSALFFRRTAACLLCGVSFAAEDDHPLGDLFCGRCREDVPAPAPPLCAHCGRSLHDPRLRDLAPGPARGTPGEGRTALGHRGAPPGPTLPSPGAGDGLCADCRRWRADARLGGALALNRSAVTLTATVRELLHRYKYGRELGLFRPLSRLLILAYLHHFAHDSFDAVTFVPMPPARERARGFNPAEALARALGRASGLPVRALLVRPDDGKRQASLGRAARLERAETLYASRDDGRPPGTRVLLVDDVYTTGSTLHACAAALRRAGWAEVVGLTVVRA
ncbi:MAG: ComF operon protein A, DNA transporter ATPase [Hydrogenibacillus schlegelii]|uniref:ComF operon protein A, DNA transporter ATPase n=1 Tax=Hydrogenibacillus schlegelii TaxID=1484 RepID=A0A2T5GBG8_HYDSH|nr:MAG: ComF operon protein A, DNA transporter ATPase [Hydrogenibacillus schlegelii]